MSAIKKRPVKRERKLLRGGKNYDYFRQYFDYDPVTGDLTWKPTAPIRCIKVKAGKEAGGKRGNYKVVNLDGDVWFIHRIAYLLMTGDWPIAFLDHKDRDGFNNKWENLRDATTQENSFNRKFNIVHGRGVCLFKGRWQAGIKINNKKKHLGYFDTKEEAMLAYDVAATKEFGEYALTNKMLGLL